MKKVSINIILPAMLCALLFLTGCVSGNYNEKIAGMTGFTADEVSVSQKSNFHQIQLNAIGGKVEAQEDGSTTVKFDHVNYGQFNPIWSTDIQLKGYQRVITAADPTVQIVIPSEPLQIPIEAPEPDLVRARGDEPLIPAATE